MAIKKNIVKDALADAKDIEKYAFESARKALEESLAPQIEQAVLNTLKEIEQQEETIEKTSINSEEKPIEEINEELKIDIAPDSELNIKVSPEGSTIELSNTNTNPTEPLKSEPEMNTYDQDQDEIFEVEGLGAEPAPAPEAGAVAEPEPSLADIETKIADLASKIDSILSAVNPEAGSEGEVEVVDDEAGQAPAPAAEVPGAAPAPQQAPAQNNVVAEDDMMFEIDEDFMDSLSEESFVTEDSIEEEINLSEMDDLDEIEIVAEEDGDAEEEEEMVDEMRGVGNTVTRSAGNRQDFEKNKKFKHAPVAHVNEGVDKIKAQYESMIDGLTKENTSLKEAVEEYKQNIQEFSDSFVELQKQINEMHVFNGKLAYANKLLSKGGLTNNEKMKIAEAFDKADSVEEAKKLYTQFINEMKSNKSVVATQVNDLKTAKPAVAQTNKTSVSETIFEGEERKRMKQLAGIIRINEG